MTDTPTTPIAVDATPTAAQIAAALRQIILVVAPLVAAAGLTGVASTLNEVLAFTGVIATVVVFVWGQLHTRSQSKKLTITANAAPDTVAVVKP